MGCCVLDNTPRLLISCYKWVLFTHLGDVRPPGFWDDGITVEVSEARLVRKYVPCSTPRHIIVHFPDSTTLATVIGLRLLNCHRCARRPPASRSPSALPSSGCARPTRHRFARRPPASRSPSAQPSSGCTRPTRRRFARRPPARR